MWYNESTKMIVSGGAINTPDRIHLIGDVPMDTLPHYGLSDNPYTVYALIDPRNGCIKYVGMSINPERRLLGHLNDRESPAKYDWLQDLRMFSLFPVILPLETGILGQSEAREREKFWIKEITDAGIELLNCPTTRGGRRLNQRGVQRMLKYYKEFGEFPDGVSPKMQRYYKREYPKIFRKRRKVAQEGA